MTFVIVGPCFTKKNSLRLARNRRTGKPFVMQSKQAVAWEQSAALQMRRAFRGEPFAAPVSMRAVFYRARDGRADLLNFLAAASDALQLAGVVVDDKWIVDFTGSRVDLDRDNPRVEIEILPLS